MCLFSPHKHKRPTTTISLSRPDGRWAMGMGQRRQPASCACSARRPAGGEASDSAWRDDETSRRDLTSLPCTATNKSPTSARPQDRTEERVWLPVWRRQTPRHATRRPPAPQFFTKKKKKEEAVCVGPLLVHHSLSFFQLSR